ncbi:hypothetical protein KXW30_003768, partial [Aspergillus fumigatus]
MSAENQGGKMVKTGFAEKSRIRGLVELRSRFFNSGREKVWHKWIDVWRPWRHSNYECQQEDPCRVLGPSRSGQIGWNGRP